MPSASLPAPPRLAALVVATGLALAGCGASAPSGDSPFPLQLRLSGGQTARDDRLGVDADGTATGRVRRAASGTGPAAPVTCTVDDAFLADLARAASEDLTPGATIPAVVGGDQETVTVTGPGGAVYGIGSGAPKVTELARRLVDDTALPRTERTLCR